MGDNEVQRPQIGDKRRRKEYGTIDGSLRTCMGMVSYPDILNASPNASF